MRVAAPVAAPAWTRAPVAALSWTAAALSRLVASAAALAPVLVILSALAAAAQPALMVVDSARVLSGSAAAQRLESSERRVRAVVEARLEEVTAALQAEERELTELRETLPAEEFAARTRDFDRRVRLERRAAQERGALLLRFFEQSRERLRAALPPVLEALRAETGAALILDAAAAVAADPALDLTDQAIARFDAATSGVRFEPPAALLGP